MVNKRGKKRTKNSRLNRNKSKKRKQRGGSNLEANLSNDNFSALVKKSYHNNAAERAAMDNMNEPFSNIGSFFKGGSKGGSVVPQFSGASNATTDNLYKIISANDQAVENGKFDSGMVMNKGGSKKRSNKKNRKKRKRTKKQRRKTHKRKSKKTRKR